MRVIFLLSVFAGLFYAHYEWRDTLGFITIQFADLEVEVDALFCLTVAVFMGLLVFYWGQCWHFLIELPKRLHGKYHAKQVDEGLGQLYKGFEALAIGDTSTAQKHAKKTAQLLPNRSVATLLQAQVAEGRGQKELAQEKFQQLTEEKSTSFIGIQGMLKQALEQKHYDSALEWAQKGRKLAPKNMEIAKNLLECQMRTGHFEEALDLLPSLEKDLDEKSGWIEAALRLQLAVAADGLGEQKQALRHIEKGLKACREFAPLVLFQAKLLNRAGEHDKAEKALANFWRDNPVDVVFGAWETHVREHHADKFLKKAIALVKPLVDEPHGALMMAKIYLAEKKLEKARELLVTALRLEKTSTGYRLLSELDDELKGGNAGYKWLKKSTKWPEAKPLSSGFVEEYDAWRQIYVLGGEGSVKLGSAEAKAHLLEALS